MVLTHTHTHTRLIAVSGPLHRWAAVNDIARWCREWIRVQSTGRGWLQRRAGPVWRQRPVSLWRRPTALRLSLQPRLWRRRSTLLARRWVVHICILQTSSAASLAGLCVFSFITFRNVLRWKIDGFHFGSHNIWILVGPSGGVGRMGGMGLWEGLVPVW